MSNTKARLTPSVIIYLFGVYVASRAVVYLAIGASALLEPDKGFATVLKAWDGSAYLDIANGGYPASNPPWHHLAFFPGFPLVIRALDFSPLGVLQSGLVVTFVGGLLAMLIIWKLCAHIFDREVADRAAVLFAFFPGSYVLSLVYSETVMIPLAALCLYALVTRQWVLAGLAAGLATGVRSNALPLVLCCAYAAAVAIRSRREWRSLIAVALAPLGFLAYMAYVHVRTSSWQTWFDVQERDWNHKTSLLAVPRQIQAFVEQRGHDLNVDVVIASLLVVVAITMAAVVWRVKMPVVLYLFAGLSLAMVITSVELSAKPRFILTAFPLLFVVAKLVPSRLFTPLIGVSAALLGVLTCVSASTLYITP